MSFAVPKSLSPSKIATFKSCPLAFKFSAIDHIPEPLKPWTVRGTLIHLALEGLFWNTGPGERSLQAALYYLDAAWDKLLQDEDIVACVNREFGEKHQDFFAGAKKLITLYFELEDPNKVNVLGVEIILEAMSTKSSLKSTTPFPAVTSDSPTEGTAVSTDTFVEQVLLRGIVDRLERNSNDQMVITDYKTGRAPIVGHEQSSLEQTLIYALLCKEVFGECPKTVQLIYIAEGTIISREVKEQSLRGVHKGAMAVWEAITTACDREDFRPRTSRLCQVCSFSSSCPAYAAKICEQ
ncbi:MAG: PD-(D/E)XK nuclease family protein [Actinobacteria bacterium]|nr:PD-(D/E)XK nuclease family protein [Actinomycetota bacterium]